MDPFDKRCVECGRVFAHWTTKAKRAHIDTCGKRCWRAMLRRQRIRNARGDGDDVTLRALRATKE